MPSHHITIAKASFTAACLRPDVTNLTRDEVLNFHSLLDVAVSRCSPPNVQNCKKWLIDHIVPSSSRTNALGKYLASYARHVKPENDHTSKNNPKVLACRKILHILYLLNDLFHHVKYHKASSEPHMVKSLQTYLPELFALARLEDKKRTARRLEDLVNIWEKDEYIDRQMATQIRRGVPEDNQGELDTPTKLERSTKEVPYTMPATHGDSAVAYYDLPAANLMPHIVPSKSVPIRPDQIRALQLSAGPADDSLVNAVKDFLKDVNRIENPHQSLEDEGIVADMDELGQLFYRNEADETMGDTYYGWSRDFCQKMKRRAKGEEDKGREWSRSSSISRPSSRDRSHSRSPAKRKRYDSSGSQSPVRDHQRHRSRSSSRPNDRLAAFRQHDTPSLSQQTLPPTAESPLNATSIPFPLLPLGPNGLPIPPPPPPSYGGPWPPPLPAGYHNLGFSPPSQFHSGPRNPKVFNPNHRKH